MFKFNFIVNDKSRKLKWIQLEEYLIDIIQKRECTLGSRLPSVSEANKMFSVSRDTVLATYRSLQDKGIISSQPGKGYYITSYKTNNKLKIFIFFDAMNQYKETLYRSLLSGLGKNYETDIAFHYYNEQLFRSLIETYEKDYGFFVLMPHFNKDVTDCIKMIPPHKLLLLDAFPNSLGKEYAAVYQDFNDDVYKGLHSLLKSLKKYTSLTVIYNDRFQFMPDSLIDGIRRFAYDFKIPLQISQNFIFSDLSKGTCYMAISDRDLAEVIKSADHKKLKIGKDIGLLSFDDTPLKEVLAGGITTISTDFALMGVQAAKLIKQRRIQQIPNPSYVAYRKSL
ncbi:MAG: GntR family transcriptional regulator [Bacteroidales bacterium]|jgi:DNA-binding transcriptional regulator YhcF (GntR family)|nr:GntR family transcriptional regulator [Bacteroidales bacterium]